MGHLARVGHQRAADRGSDYHSRNSHKEIAVKNLLLVLLLAPLLAFGQQSYREISLGAAVVTATGSQADVDTAPTGVRYVSGDGRLVIDVTAVSGTTPSAIFELQGKVGSQYYALCTLTAITAVGKGTCTAVSIPAVVRLAYTITGTTPSFTFSASVVKH